jgi:hypothetical protein
MAAGAVALVMLAATACASAVPGINLFEAADLATATSAEIAFPGGFLITVTSDAEVAKLAGPLDQVLPWWAPGHCREQVPVSFLTAAGRTDFTYCRDDAVLTGSQEYWESPAVPAPERFVVEFEALADLVPDG